MILCSSCGGSSPNDARFCIECGFGFQIQANVGETIRFATVNNLDKYLPYPQPYAMPTGAPVYGVDYQPFYIYRRDLPAFVNQLTLNEAKEISNALWNKVPIYYKGRQIIFLD